MDPKANGTKAHQRDFLRSFRDHFPRGRMPDRSSASFPVTINGRSLTPLSMTVDNARDLSVTANSWKRDLRIYRESRH